jgi:hypothetical protein
MESSIGDIKLKRLIIGLVILLMLSVGVAWAHQQNPHNNSVLLDGGTYDIVVNGATGNPPPSPGETGVITVKNFKFGLPWCFKERSAVATAEDLPDGTFVGGWWVVTWTFVEDEDGELTWLRTETLDGVVIATSYGTATKRP